MSKRRRKRPAAEQIIKKLREADRGADIQFSAHGSTPHQSSP